MTKAVYATMCPRCDRLIHPGDRIAPTADDVWVHERCAAGGDDGLAGPDEGQCVRCGLIQRSHLLDATGFCEGCRG